MDTNTIIGIISAMMVVASTILGVYLNHYLSRKRNHSGGFSTGVRTRNERTSTTQPLESPPRRARIPRAAVLAFRFGLLAIPLPFFAVSAIVTGVRAVRVIRGSAGRLGGLGRACTGIALGSFMLLVMLVALAGFA